MPPAAGSEAPLGCQVLHRPGIPVQPLHKFRKDWFCMCVSAVLFYVVLYLTVRPMLYSVVVVNVGGAAELHAELEGCEVMVQERARSTLAHGASSTARLGYWTFMGEGSVAVNSTTGVVRVSASSWGKTIFKCMLLVEVPRQSVRPHLRILNLTVSPSAHQLTAKLPSNSAEMILVDVRDVHASEGVFVTVSCPSRTLLAGLRTRNATVKVIGGSLDISDDGGSAPEHLRIDAIGAGVEVRLHRNDAELSLDAATMGWTSLASAQLMNGSSGGRYLLGHGSGRVDPSVRLDIHAAGSAVYVLAADEHFMGGGSAGSCPELQTKVGSEVAAGPALTPAVEHILNTSLKSWLVDQATHGNEFVVYFKVAMPRQKDSGVMKLLSSEVYAALPPWAFAVISGGSMEPEVMRVAMPVTGVPGLFPGRPCDVDSGAGLSQRELGTSLVRVADRQVDLAGLGLNATKWVWDADPGNGVSFIFDFVSAKNGHAARWRPRPPSSASKFAAFTNIALGITAFVGIYLSMRVIGVSCNILRPHILHKIRKVDIFSTASYRLEYTIQASTWVLTATHIQFPANGLLLRWKPRPLANKFASFTFEAQPWPPAPDAETIKVSGLDPATMPCAEQPKDHKCFLLLADTNTSVSDMSVFAAKFDVEINEVARMQCGLKRPAMKFGVAYRARVVAHDAAGKVVEESAWSRPAMVQPPRATTYFPFLFCRNVLNMCPEDPFSYFLEQMCEDVEDIPNVFVNVKAIKLAVDSASTLFAGEASNIIGSDKLPDYYQQRVRVQFSSSDSKRPAYEATRPALLPTAEQRRAKQLVKESFQAALPEAARRGMPQRPPETKYVVLDYGSDALGLKVPFDLTQVICIEAVLMRPDGDCDATAKAEMTWGSLLQQAVQHAGGLATHGRSRAVGVPLDVLLRDGLTPVAVLSVEFSFEHTTFGAPALETPVESGFPRVFGSVVPAQTFVYGETCVLSWKPLGEAAVSSFDIVLVSESSSSSDPTPTTRGAVSKRSKGYFSLEQVVAKDVGTGAGRAPVVMGPCHPPTNQRIWCHLEARASSGGGQRLARSADFCVTRAVTLQELELTYAAFCVRNRIPMRAVSAPRLFDDYGIDTAQRKVRVARGYRLPVPIPAEAEAAAFRARERPTVVKDKPSMMIVGNSPLLVVEPSTAGASSLPPREAVKTSTPASASAGLSAASAPLLETGTRTAADLAPKTTEVPSETTTMLLATNVFWKWDNGARADQELLLMFFCFPKVLTLKWFQRKLGIRRRKMLYMEDVLFSITKALKIIFGVLLYSFQLLALASPCYMLLLLWIWHDMVIVRVASDMEPDPETLHMRLHEFIADPTWPRWSCLSQCTRLFFMCILVYYVIMLIAMIFFNFFAVHILRMKHGKRILSILDAMIGYLILFCCFLLMTLLTVVLIWTILGAIVNPSKLLPSAIALVSVLAITWVFKGKLEAMRDHVTGIIGNVLDHVLHAVFTVTFGELTDAEAVASQQSAIECKEFASEVSTYMESNEKVVQESIYKKSAIKSQVQETLMESMRLLRASPQFKIFDAKAISKNKVLMTDFMPGNAGDQAESTKLARQAADEEFEIEHPDRMSKKQREQAAAYSAAASAAVVRKDGEQVQAGQFEPPPILLKHLLQAVSRMDVVNTDTSGGKPPSWLGPMASENSLRYETVRAVYLGYVKTIHDQRVRYAQVEPKLNDACALAATFSHIRRIRLFDHFTDEGAESNLSSGPSSQQKVPNVYKMMQTLQNKEMENLSTLTATALTRRLNWDSISREASDYANIVLPTEVLSKAIHFELSPQTAGSTAFALKMKAYDLAFKNFDSVYQVSTALGSERNEVQFFVDCGVITPEQARNPTLLALIKNGVAAQLAFDGSCCPDTLLTAMAVLFSPRCQATDAEGIVAFSYLWYDALEQILKKSGMNVEDETTKKWLLQRWDVATEGLGIFPYQGLPEVADLILTAICGGGLWPAAVKALMLRLKVGGYIGCDVARDGAKKAAKAAQALQFVDLENLRAVEEAAGEWPPEAVGLWNRCAPAPGGHGGPRLLPAAKLVDFLQSIVYDSEEDNRPHNALHPLAPYASDWQDLLWNVDAEGRMWHSLPTGTRCMRGLFMEVALELYGLMSSVPQDMDVFCESLFWQLSAASGGQLLAAARQAGRISSLQLPFFGKWLSTEYFKRREWCSFPQFKGIMVDMLGVDLPDTTLHAVFGPCPKDPDDDKGELRFLHDLGAALLTHLGYGMWKDAVRFVVMDFIPYGPRQSKALEKLDEEFQEMDVSGRGFLQPGEVVLLVRRLAVLGLTCDDIDELLRDKLKLEVPHKELHKYFAMMDVHVDGIVQAEEFIPMIAFLTLDFFPAQILANLKLSTGWIAYNIAAVIVILGLLFLLMDLVVGAFAIGSTVAAVHSSANAMTAYVAKQASDSSIGFEDTMANLKRELNNLVIQALCVVIGLSKDVMDKLVRLIAEGI